MKFIVLKLNDGRRRSNGRHRSIWTSQMSFYTALATVEEIVAGWDYFQHYKTHYEVFEVDCERFTNVYCV
jgi:hypothetical protein